MIVRRNGILSINHAIHWIPRGEGQIIRHLIYIYVPNTKCIFLYSTHIASCKCVHHGIILLFSVRTYLQKNNVRFPYLYFLLILLQSWQLFFICFTFIFIGEAAVPVANCNKREYGSHPKQEMNLKDYLSYWKDYRSAGYPEDMDCLYLKDFHFNRWFIFY